MRESIGPKFLSWAQLPTPKPEPGEVRSAIKAVSLNFPNLLIVQNKYQLKLPLSFMHEAEHAGVIDALGSEARNLRIGLPMDGGFRWHRWFCHARLCRRGAGAAVA